MILPFILTLIAGLSTLIGVLPIFIKNLNKDKIIAISWAFASGVMLCLSVFDLIPEGIKEIGIKHNSLFTITISLEGAECITNRVHFLARSNAYTILIRWRIMPIWILQLILKLGRKLRRFI